MLSKKQILFNYLKNIPGWSTKRKIVVFSVDDYGNIRLASKVARENLIRVGLNMDSNRFDRFDALETAEDLSLLFEVLTSVKDKNQRSAVFTPFALSANIDFERMEKEGYRNYYYQLLPDTLNQLPGYEGTWSMWQEGIREKIFLPQYHGREHVNIKLLMEWTASKNSKVLACLKERSWTGLEFSPYPTLDYVSAFSFDQFQENKKLALIAEDGLKIFKKNFQYKATQFISPGGSAHSILEKTLSEGGIRFIDSQLLKKEHQGDGKYSYKLNVLGGKSPYDAIYQIRNSVFEPLLNKNNDWVDQTLSEIEIAFHCRKPAIISSHRVNFCGHIDSSVRSHGLKELQRLLFAIVNKWPEVEFMASNELGELMLEPDKQK
ncbi:MAG: hypothetical protein L3J29_00755 [Cyclobacteriaceae bacterium]|nr:hypothetical protein [Cyclobacteriaceae bacterium]